MSDVVDSATRSRMMRGIKGADTQPELRVRRRMHAAGLRYRLRCRDLPGRPDIVFRRIQTAVFVHGCFWHQHAGCPYAAMPGTNPEFWARKFRENAERDLRVQSQLEQMGWATFVLWECATNQEIGTLVERIKATAIAKPVAGARATEERGTPGREEGHSLPGA